MTKCLICGAEFPDELIAYPIQGQPDNKTPREICRDCIASSSRKAVKRSYNPPSIVPFMELAGAVERQVVRQYRDAYLDALKAASKLFPNCDTITHEELVFLVLHREFTTSVYHYALTMGHNAEIADATRRDVEKEFKYFKVMKKQGYNIFERGKAS